MFDEVQTGIGRTGNWFAWQGAGVEPDVFTLAKALGGGLPIGACIARDQYAFAAGEHASTFGGGPIPCRAALAVLDVVDDEGLLENCTERGRQLTEGLTAAGFQVRGAGLLLGVAFPRPVAGDVIGALMRRGFLATEAGPAVVRISPPLTVTEQEVAAFVEAFPDAAREALKEEPE
jgi:acetylornithine aminotransferase